MTEEFRSITGLIDMPSPPQIAAATYVSSTAPQVCGICGQVIAVRSYIVESRVACVTCASRGTKPVEHVDHARFLRGILFGGGAAVFGCAFYAAFSIVTHMYLGFIAFAVGWFIAKAMLIGSLGERGRKYQIAAAVLTYAAISMAWIPILMAAALRDPFTQPDWAKLAAKLVVWGLASPLLQVQFGVSGMLGLLILAIGLRIAWRMTGVKPNEKRSMVSVRA